MKILNTVIIVCALVFLVEAREKHECETKHGITDSDWEEMKRDRLHISDKFACFIKCALEKDESLDAEGKVNIEKYDAIMRKYVNLTDTEEVELNKCLKTTGLVKTCNDVRPIQLCVAKSKGYVK
ncbi:hypothetical protein WA026_010873 [Henosepilachna vigintioctopunctata]|uniref:Uncharacterized protein n=1 Tax=Henosepilachna vigintioctopunctata TaxID=420089 RepID=A0AAW1UZS7_9CUCU